MVTELPSGAALACITAVLLPATGWYPGNLDMTGRVCRARRLLEVEGNECVRRLAHPSGSVFLWVPAEADQEARIQCKWFTWLASPRSPGGRLETRGEGRTPGSGGGHTSLTGGSALGSSGRQRSTQTHHWCPVAWGVRDEHFIHQLPALIDGSFWEGWLISPQGQCAPLAHRGFLEFLSFRKPFRQRCSSWSWESLRPWAPACFCFWCVGW